MPYVTGEDVLTHVGQDNPSDADTAWADICAAAIEGLIAHRLFDIVVDPGSHAENELIAAARNDAAAMYTRRKTPHGIVNVGPDQDAARLGPDATIALGPVLLRLAGPGIG